jgi:hypothetical protein
MIASYPTCLGLFMFISLILVVCCSSMYAISVQCYRFCLNLHVRVTLRVPHQLSLLVFGRSFVIRVASVKSDPLGPTKLPLVKSNILLDLLNMNNLIGEVSLRFYLRAFS